MPAGAGGGPGEASGAQGGRRGGRGQAVAVVSLCSLLGDGPGSSLVRLWGAAAKGQADRAEGLLVMETPPSGGGIAAATHGGSFLGDTSSCSYPDSIAAAARHALTRLLAPARATDGGGWALRPEPVGGGGARIGPDASVAAFGMRIVTCSLETPSPQPVQLARVSLLSLIDRGAVGPLFTSHLSSAQ